MVQQAPPRDKIIFFDGICVLCNNTVDFLIRHDKMQRLKFASLQSDIAKQLIPGEMLIKSNAETVIFFDRQKIYTHSEAILRIMGNLPFPYNMLLVFMVIPTFLRDMAYNFIAKKRYRWFGKRESCRLPDAASKGRILG